MRKRLKIAVMLTATTAIATSFSLAPPSVWAAEGDSTRQGITTTEEHGRKVYVNDDVPAQKRVSPGSAIEALIAGVLEQQGEPLEASSVSEYGLDASGAVGSRRSHPVFWS